MEMSWFVIAVIVGVVIFLTELLKKISFMAVPLWFCLTPMIMVFVGFLGNQALIVKNDITVIFVINALLAAVIIGGAAAGVYKTIQVVREHFGWGEDEE